MSEQEPSTTPQQFSDALRALIDPQTPEEVLAFNESQTRVEENARRLHEQLPSGPNGEIGGLRMSFIHDLPQGVDVEVLQEN